MTEGKNTVRAARRLLAGFVDELDRRDYGVVVSILGVVTVLLFAVLFGIVGFQYFLYLLMLSGMYALLSLGLNVQWGYAGLINFSVAAFWGVGAYAVAMVTAAGSPLGLELHPIAGFLAAILASTVIAVLIGIPTLRLRADYLAIATLGLAEVIRIVIRNERDLTAGTRGIPGVPQLFNDLLAVSFVSKTAIDLVVVTVFVIATYAFLRRVHRSPWGRVLRTIRADEDLAEALGKNTYAFKMQAFVLGSVLMSLAGALYAFHALYLQPSELLPLQTFFVWVAVILGGTASNRGALVGGFVIVAITEGTRHFDSIPFVSDVVMLLNRSDLIYGVSDGSLRLFLVGLLIILVIRYRPEGLLPPRDELIWPDATEGGESHDR